MGTIILHQVTQIIVSVFLYFVLDYDIKTVVNIHLGLTIGFITGYYNDRASEYLEKKVVKVLSLINK